MDVRVGLWRKLSAEELMLLNCGVGEDSWESLGLQGDQSWVFFGRNDAKAETPVPCSTSCEELIHWERLWCWEGLGTGGDWNNRRWDGWMASPTWWTWVWVNFGSWWWMGRPGVLWFMGLEESDTTEWLNCTELKWFKPHFSGNTLFVWIPISTLNEGLSTKYLRVSGHLGLPYSCVGEGDERGFQDKGHTCTPMADSCQSMAKTTTIL